jgi:hypothetical protein
MVGGGKFGPTSAEQSRIAGLFRRTTLSSGSRRNRKSGKSFGSERIEKIIC